MFASTQSVTPPRSTGLLPGSGSFQDIVAATRQLVGAWDRAMSQWSTDELEPLGIAPAGEADDADGVGVSNNRWAALDGPMIRAPGAERGQRPRHPGRATAATGAHTLSVSALHESIVAGGLIVQMLDGFQIWTGAREVVDIPRGKTRSVLKFLLLNRRRPVTRSRLTRLFWPDADPSAARNCLNVTLHRLRKALGNPALLIYANDAYQLQIAGAAWIDVEEFLGHAEEGRSAAAQGRNTQAIRHYELAAALYCSDLIDEGDPEPALQTDAQALRDRLNQVLEALAALQETRHEHHACLQATLRHLQIDACNEAAHQRLMRCYAQMGQPQLAERQYRACVKALRDALGLSPSDATTALYRRIAARQFPGLAHDAVVAPTLAPTGAHKTAG